MVKLISSRISADNSAPSPASVPVPARAADFIAASRFALSGALCLVVGTALLYFLTERCHFHYLVSTFLGSLLTNALGFTLNRRWAFRDRARRYWRELGRYYLVNTGSLALNVALMALVVGGLRVPYLWASIALSGLMALGNFLLHRNWSFGAR